MSIKGHVLLFFAKLCFTKGMMHDIVVRFQTFVIYGCRKMYTLIIHLSDVSTKYYSVYTVLLHFLSNYKLPLGN